MIVFIDDILGGNIATILGQDLYAQTVSKIVVWWAVLPLVGIILAFCGVLWALFTRRGS